MGNWENRRSRPEQKRGIFKFSQTLSKNFDWVTRRKRRVTPPPPQIFARAILY